MADDDMLPLVVSPELQKNESLMKQVVEAVRAIPDGVQRAMRAETTFDVQNSRVIGSSHPLSDKQVVIGFAFTKDADASDVLERYRDVFSQFTRILVRELAR